MPELTEEQRKEWEEKVKNMSPEELQQLQKQQCIFCQIISGKVPSKKVYEDVICLAILDINPAAKGHILLLPKEHYAIMPQLPENVLKHLSIVAKHLSQILLKTMRADGTTLFIANGAAAGQRAQHFMIHLIPRKAGDRLLQAEERLVGAEMVLKVKTAIESKLLGLLGGKKVVPKEKEDSQKEEMTEAKAQLKEREPEIFITSAAAKRYHKEKCPFAQNIPLENKIILSKEEAEQSARKPCTCVSGKKIPLVKPVSDGKSKKEGRKKESKTESKDESKDGKQLPLKKSQTKIPGPKSGTGSKTKRGGEASLDDIANLFR